MESGTDRDILELLASCGYWKSEDCSWKYYRYSKADRGNRHTVHEVHIHSSGFWEHSLMPMVEDRGWLAGGSGEGVDSLKAYLQKEDGDVLKGETRGAREE
jgi:hypothetical protein